MTPANLSPGVRMNVTTSDKHDGLVMQVFNGAHCALLHLSVDQARTISLELIKNAYQAEVKNNLQKSKPNIGFTFKR